METIISQRRGKKTEKSRRVWSNKEEDVLVDALKELCNTGWKCGNGTFKAGYTVLLEKTMRKAFPRTDLKASPHIESKIKVWKKQCCCIASMLTKEGFGWSEANKCITAEDDAWESYLKRNPKVYGMRYKSFPHYLDLKDIFGKETGVGNFIEGPSDTAEEMEKEEEGVNHEHEAIDDIDASLSVIEVRNDQENDVPRHRSKKRRSSADGTPSGLLAVLSELRALTERIEEKLGMLVKRVCPQDDKAAARRELYGALCKIPALDVKDKLKAAHCLARDPCSIDIFFSLPDEDKPKMVEMVLAGEL